MDIARTDLFERVWTTPLIKLAAEFGVSDVALAKACRRHHIPKPPMGHWTRVEYGRGTPKPALPPAPHGEVVRFSQEQSRVQKAAKLPPPRLGVAVPVPVSASVAPRQTAPFALATAAYLRKARPTPVGLVFSGGAAHYDCKLGPASIERAQGLLSALEEALPKVGGQVKRGAEGEPLALDFEGQRVRFAITERSTSTELPLNPKRGGLYVLKEYSYRLTGELKIAIDGYFDGRKSWADGVHSKLEAKLPEVLEGLVAAGTALRNRAREQEEQRKQWAQQAREREEREAQLRRRAQFREAFAVEAGGWRRHQESAAYLAHLKEQVAADLLPQISQEWLQLAQQAVGDLDPSGKRLGMLAQGVQPGYDGPFGKKLVAEMRPGQSPYL
jgi:hypothetical protein